MRYGGNPRNASSVRGFLHLLDGLYGPSGIPEVLIHRKRKSGILWSYLEDTDKHPLDYKARIHCPTFPLISCIRSELGIFGFGGQRPLR